MNATPALACPLNRLEGHSTHSATSPMMSTTMHAPMTIPATAPESRSEEGSGVVSAWGGGVVRAGVVGRTCVLTAVIPVTAMPYPASAALRDPSFTEVAAASICAALSRLTVVATPMVPARSLREVVVTASETRT